MMQPSSSYRGNYACRLKPLQLHSRVITGALASYPIVVVAIVDGAYKVRCVTPFISQIKGFRRSNRDKGITSVVEMRLGCVRERRRTAGSRYNNVLHDIFRWPENKYVSRTHRPTNALTHSRTHVIALIHPCDSRQSEEGRRTPRTPSFSFSLSSFLHLLV